MKDIFFLDYYESYADEHWEILSSRFPIAKRIGGIKGLKQAHTECARQSTTNYFYVVDADAAITSNFDFSFSPCETKEAYPGVLETECVHIFHSRNPVNGLEYGYGAVKLFPRHQFLSNNVTEYVDMTTSLQLPIVVHPIISNITYFNSDPFNTWRSAFRECVKLSSSIIQNQINTETAQRLKIWQTVGNGNHGSYSIQGAKDGTEYGSTFKSEPDKLSLINDFDWLKEKFQAVK